MLHAQDDQVLLLDPSNVPATGATQEAFVPKGWKIEEPIRGDLNNDKRPDVVLDLIEDKPAESAEGVPSDRSRAIVVLFTEADGSLRRAAIGTAVLYCTTCGGTLSDPSGSGGLIRIEKGVMVVDQISGSREATNLVQRFRWNAAEKSMMLIGEDATEYDRLTGKSELTSINYLTGVKIVERHAPDRRGNDKMISRKKSKVNVGPVPIERIGEGE